MLPVLQKRGRETAPPPLPYHSYATVTITFYHCFVVVVVDHFFDALHPLPFRWHQ